MKYILNLLLLLLSSSLLAARPGSGAETCPVPPAVADQTNVIINEINNSANWIELFVPANTTVDFTDWKFILNSSGNNPNGNGTETICTSNCTFSGGTNGIFVIYGNVPAGVVHSISNTSFTLHNTIQEILMVDGTDKLVHYLNYKNTNSNTNSFEYLDCVSAQPDFVTEITMSGNNINYCTDNDGQIQESNSDWSNWSACDESSAGTSNDGPPPATCPDITTYNLIFDDDFTEDVYQLSSTWNSVDFSRRLSVWPNDRIKNIRGEERDLVYEISNDTLQIAGDIVNNGNNEFGVLLHDVGSQGYSPNVIQEYAIETSISAFADQSGNNDVGVVFGYQSENDFYLLRWTKIGVDNENDTSFPGTYRSLDLLHVVNGSPTLLTTESDFYPTAPTDPMSIRVTVNSDGISICINGIEVMTYTSAQPYMYSVGLFSYDNDYQHGLQVSDFKIYCSNCLAEGFIGWWPMEDNFEDIVGDNDLSIIGNITFESSNVAKTVGNNSTCKYAVMDGASYGEVDDSGYLNSEELAVSAWVYPTSYPNDANDTNGNSSLMAISSKDVNYEFHINANGKLYWWWRNQNGDNRSLTSVNNVPLNTWSHVAISYKKGEQKMYINGELENSSTLEEVPQTSSCNYYIGADVESGSCNVLPERNFIGELDEVRIYGRYLEKSEVEADMDYLRQCGLVNLVDHYKITHPEKNLSCSATSITVEACSEASNDGSCAPVLEPDITGNIQYTVNNNATTLSGINMTGSLQQLDFNYSELETITLGLDYLSPDAPFQCFYDTGIASNCDITYQPFGYIVTAQDIISSESVSDSNNRISVQAVEAIANNPAICEPSLVGQKDVNIDFTYNAPPTGYDAEQLNVSLDDSSYTLVTSTLGTQQSLNFNNTDATAYFYVRYGDAGTLNISVSDPSGNYVTGSDVFNIIPARLSLVMDDGTNELGSSGNETHYAAQPFNLTIQALNADGNVTNNYRPQNLELQPVMSAPLIIDGAQSVGFYYAGSHSLSVDNSATWQTPSSITFNNSGYSSSVAQFDNVGTFTVDIRDRDYLGYEINSNSASNAGRFIPAYFSIEDVTASPGINIENTHGSFSYIGENLNYETVPTFNYVAKTFTNLIATNYGGTSYKFGNNVFDLNSRTYTEQNSAPGFVGVTPNISKTGENNYDGVFQFTLPDSFTFVKPVTPVEPITLAVNLDIPLLDLTDDDGVGYDSNGINSDLPAYENYTINDIGNAVLRYGRLTIENAMGPEDVTLKIEAKVEYYSGGRYITNVDDSTTDFSNLTATLTYEDESLSSFTLSSVGTTFDSGITKLNEGLFVNPLNPAVAAELTLKLNNVPDYLNIDWDNDNGIDSDDMASSSVIFGRYRGNDRIIYKRER